jgi:hypothetical protein
MNKYFYTLVCCLVIISFLPNSASAQTSTTTIKTPRKYDKLLTAVEAFAKLNAQIEIREREFTILAPFVENVKDYSNQLATVCDMKCGTSVGKYYPKLKKFSDALYEAHRRYQEMSPNITERNAALMSEIQRVELTPVQLNKEKAIADLNRLNLENIYHYKAYAKTYHSADTSMLSLATTSDLMLVINSYASTTDRLVKIERAPISMNTAIANLKNKVPGVRAQIKAFEDRRKSLVCTATLKQDFSVDVQCLP